MVALFLDDNKTNDNGDGKENGKKNVYINKQHLSTCITRHYDMKRPNFTSPLYGLGENNKKWSLYFSKHR